jgi:hypothetical protein
MHPYPLRPLRVASYRLNSASWNRTRPKGPGGINVSNYTSCGTIDAAVATTWRIFGARRQCSSWDSQPNRCRTSKKGRMPRQRFIALIVQASLGTAERLADRPSRLVDLVRRTPSVRNTAAISAQSGQRGGNGELVPSNIPVAKVGLTSDTPVLIDKRSLFEAVPLSIPLCGSGWHFKRAG